MPKLPGEKFDEWVTQWRNDNLTEKEEINIGSWVASRFKAGKNAIGLEWLEKMPGRQGKPFENAAAFSKRLDDEGFPPEVKEKMIAASVLVVFLIFFREPKKADVAGTPEG